MTLFMISTKFFVGVGTAFGAFPDVERNLVERVVVPFVNRALYGGRNSTAWLCPMPFSGRTARDERPHSFRGARHHCAGRL